MRRNSFALMEVCVALALVGLAIAFFARSMRQTIERYQHLEDEICCYELAHEQLARIVACHVTSTESFDEMIQDYDHSQTHGRFTIRVCRTPEAFKGEHSPACLVALTVSVSPIREPALKVSLSTELCFERGGV